MRRNGILSAAALAALLAGAAGAAAQAQGVTGELREAEDEDAVVQPLGKTVDEVEDMDVVGAGGEEVGEVEEVLADGTGQPAALAVEAGGFLGVGEKTVVMPIGEFRVQDDGLATSLTKEQLEALPEWDD